MRNLQTSFKSFIKENKSNDSVDKKVIEIVGSVEDYLDFLDSEKDIINPVKEYAIKKIREVLSVGSLNDAKDLLRKIKGVSEYDARAISRDIGVSMFKMSDIKENTSNDIPIGTEVKTSMGVRRTGKVIPWFYWKDATDGTYSEKNKDDYIAVKWDDGTKGFNAISNTVIIHPDGRKEELGRLLTDDEYDTTSDTFEVRFDDGSVDSGQIEFEDGTVDNFIIYDDGKVAFDNWYPSNKNKLLIDKIKQVKEEI